VKIRRILCPIDFSDHSRRALNHAGAIARWYGSRITVLHVFSCAPQAVSAPGSVVLETTVLTPIGREQLRLDANAFVEAKKAAGIPIDAIVREGNPTDEIVNEASSMDADLIVIGTHGRSGFDRLLLGWVAEKVLRKATCPVLTVPRQCPDAPVSPILLERILCPVDFSRSSLRALEHAVSLAQETEGQLVVLHVSAHELGQTGDGASVIPDPDMTIADSLKEREDAIRRRLQECIAGVTEFCSVETMMTHGKPWREILRIAAERQSQLIVMGVQGRGAAGLLFFGSTTQHVVRQAACPVLTLRHN
jgi:nucleotide-binding universal stress UspA family protein